MSRSKTRREIVRALIAIVVAVTGLTAVPAAAAPAAQPRPPGLDHVQISTHRLPGTGGHVTVSGAVHGALRCRLQVHPALPHGQFDKPCRGSRVHWRIRIPANDVTHARTYRLRILAIGKRHTVVSRHRSIVVARPRAPHFTALSLSTAQLPSTGGVVRFAGTPTAARTCTLTVTPHILGLPHAHPCRTARTTWAVRVPPNPTDTQRSYRFTIQARGAANQIVSRSRAVTEAAQTPTCPGQTDSGPPQTDAFFNDPTSANAADHQVVVDAMINLICSASPPVDGEPTSIDFAMYIDESQAVTDALLWAQQYRSAVVHVALDGANGEILTAAGDRAPNPAYQELVAGLPPGSVVLCGHNSGQADTTGFAGTGCAGDNILHDKLLLVSSVDNLGDSAVLTTSQNLTSHAVDSSFNNGLQLVGNRAVYAATRSYFDQLMTNTRNPQLGQHQDAGPFNTSSGSVTFTAYPRNATANFPIDNSYDASNDDRTDAIADLLETVSCTAPGRFAGDHTHYTAQTTVRIAMYSYGPRDLITERLIHLERDGCRVQVIYSSMARTVRTALVNNGIKPLKLNDSAFPLADGQVGRIFLHDKYLLISGAMVSGGHVVRNQDIVQSGSENLTQLGLHHNDDQTLRLQQTATGHASDIAVFHAYDTNWSRLLTIVKTAKSS